METQNLGLHNPAVQAKRKELAQIIYPISRKAIQWGTTEGYAALFRDVDKFMEHYRTAMKAQAAAQAAAKAALNANGYYERQSPEALSLMLQRSQNRADRIAEALKAKMNGAQS